MHTPRFVAYFRVSTQRQGQSGLGLAAQQQAVRAYLGREPDAAFVEIESGKAAHNRPQLTAAFAECRLTGATLLVAKLDRLSRDAHFLLGLRDAGVEFIAADMPHANRLTVGIMAVIAEQEREAISRRTKEALAAAKARGQKLGGFRGHRVDGRLGGDARKAASDAFAASVGPMVAELRASGLSLRQVAAALVSRGVRTALGGTWTACTVRLVERRHGDLNVSGIRT